MAHFSPGAQVVLEHFDQVVGDCFMDCVNCLIAFANNKLSAGISLKVSLHSIGQYLTWKP